MSLRVVCLERCSDILVKRGRCGKAESDLAHTLSDSITPVVHAVPSPTPAGRPYGHVSVSVYDRRHSHVPPHAPPTITVACGFLLVAPHARVDPPARSIRPPILQAPGANSGPVGDYDFDQEELSATTDDESVHTHPAPSLYLLASRVVDHRARSCASIDARSTCGWGSCGKAESTPAHTLSYTITPLHPPPPPPSPTVYHTGDWQVLQRSAV